MERVQDYVCIDLETTGLHPKRDRIMEIGAVRVRQGRVEATFSQLVNPRQEIDEKVHLLTGISNEDVADMPAIDEVLPRLSAFLGQDVLVGHNILFDYSFLKRAFINAGEEFERQGVDTLRIARKYVKGCASKRLESLCEYYHIDYHPHRALEDALATSALYGKLAEEITEEDGFAPRELVFKVKKEGPITGAQKQRLEGLLKKHSLKPKTEVDSLTKNEASRYIDRILAEYGR
jgi:DNA polymerase-3 subunit alpha (Gram-positive type)